ncbi:hypothetical protein KAR91_60585 [Candidatus Pacearchaeota archaeon]|nr:hypothetical protein [Candidatus Pacearchaeota archaeon]
MSEEQEEKTDLEVDDKIRIVSEDGYGHNAKVFVNGKEFRHHEKISIEILPNSLVQAQLKVSSTKLDIKAAVSEIEQEKKVSERIKAVIDNLPEQKKWKGIAKRDKAYEAISNIIDILYPNGNRVYPE